MSISESSTGDFVRGTSNPPPVHEASPDRAPPSLSVGLIGWLRTNLFSGIFSSVLSILFSVLVLYVLYIVIDWAIVSAVFLGDGREVCNAQAKAARASGGTVGACWVFVSIRMDQFIYGFFPKDLYWRPTITFFLGLAGVIYVLMDKVPFKGWVAVGLLVPYPLFAHIMLSGGTLEFGTYGIRASNLVLFLIMAGVVWYLTQRVDVSERMAKRRNMMIVCGVFSIFISTLYSFDGDIEFLSQQLAVPTGLEHVETSKWGGFLLTLVIATVGIAVSLPIGVALALGRRSQMPVVRMICIGFIELVRAVPLITILFMASVILPLFLPPGNNFDILLRALIGVTLFSAAYMAETIRGGLQALPRGQYEAAEAMGLRYWQYMRLIILPQALKIVIPAIVSSFIGLFKDTTLVLIIGLNDLLLMTQLAVTDAKWIGLQTEGYAFAAAVFFVFCFGMSRYSLYLERRLDTGHGAKR